MEPTNVATSDEGTSDGDATMAHEHSEETHTLANHAQVMPLQATSGARGQPPKHVRNWISLTTPMISYALNYPVARGFSVKLLVLLLAYFGVLMYTGTLNTSPFTDPRRPSDIAVSQLPLVIAFAQKNNILAVLSGMGYEKVPKIPFFISSIYPYVRSSIFSTDSSVALSSSPSTCTLVTTVRTHVFGLRACC